MRFPTKYYEKYSSTEVRFPRHHLTALFPRRRSSSWAWTRTIPKLSSATWATAHPSAHVENGKCVDTSMGLTPLEGLDDGYPFRRSGSGCCRVYLQEGEHRRIRDAAYPEQRVRRTWHCPTDLSSDFRDLEEAVEQGNEACSSGSLDAFCYRVAKYIGSYVAAMNGVDAIAFTGGIGENDDRGSWKGTLRLPGISWHQD